MSSELTPEEEYEPSTDICRVCGEEITMMAYRGSGFCNLLHQKEWEKENPPPINLSVSYEDISAILKSAGVKKEHRKAVEEEWKALLSSRMPHLIRRVDTK